MADTAKPILAARLKKPILAARLGFATAACRVVQVGRSAGWITGFRKPSGNWLGQLTESQGTGSGESRFDNQVKLNQRSLELSHHSNYLKHQSSGGRAQVQIAGCD